MTQHLSDSAAPNEIRIQRVYDAPLQVVWDAWTDPEQVAQCWGPRGFTLTHHSKELRTGGHWNYTMHGPDGIDYPNSTKYLEVVPLAKLVCHQPQLRRAASRAVRHVDQARAFRALAGADRL